MADALQYDPAKDYAAGDLEPLYRQILGPGPNPVVDLGPITLDAALGWLRRQHATYAAAIGKRSHLIQNMPIKDRVTFTGLADE